MSEEEMVIEKTFEKDGNILPGLPGRLGQSCMHQHSWDKYDWWVGSRLQVAIRLQGKYNTVCDWNTHISWWCPSGLSVPVRGRLTDVSGLHAEPLQSISCTSTRSEGSILHYVSLYVVDIVAHVGFVNTFQFFSAWTCFGKFQSCL